MVCVQAPGSDKMLVGVAGACTALLGARFVEYVIYETKEDQFGKGPIARVIDFFSTFMGQVVYTQRYTQSLVTIEAHKQSLKQRLNSKHFAMHS